MLRGAVTADNEKLMSGFFLVQKLFSFSVEQGVAILICCAVDVETDKAPAKQSQLFP